MYEYNVSDNIIFKNILFYTILNVDINLCMYVYFFFMILNFITIKKKKDSILIF